MDLRKYFDQTKNLLDFYIRTSDYKNAFNLLLKALDQLDECYLKDFINHFKDENKLIEDKDI